MRRLSDRSRDSEAILCLNAGQASEAAVSFGQDDDITVLTLTKLGVGKASAPQRNAPILSPV